MHGRFHPKLFFAIQAQTSLRSKGLTTAFSTSGTGEGCPCGASVHNHRLQLSWSPYLSCSLKTWLRKKYLTNVSSFRQGHFALHVGYRWIFLTKRPDRVSCHPSERPETDCRKHLKTNAKAVTAHIPADFQGLGSLIS